MTRQELNHVKKVLEHIKPRENGIPHGQVQLAINYVEKDLALRAAQRSAFKDQFEFEHDNFPF